VSREPSMGCLIFAHRGRHNWYMCFTYILRSLKDNSYYIGSTREINQRLKRHNSGFVPSTRNKRPYELVYFEEYNSYSLARKRELKIKSWKKRSAIEKLINIGPVV